MIIVHFNIFENIFFGLLSGLVLFTVNPFGLKTAEKLSMQALSQQLLLPDMLQQLYRHQAVPERNPRYTDCRSRCDAATQNPDGDA